MKPTVVILSAVSMAHAFAGMPDLLKNLPRGQDDVNIKKLPGDLEGQDDRKLSSTGSLIKRILEGRENPEDRTTSYTSVPGKNSAACRRDKCCIWKHIADEMKSKMVGGAGRCNNLARQAVRMGFHDAAAWSLNTGRGGGADGSLVLARECYNRKDNAGMKLGCDQMQAWYNKYRPYGISMADLIQMGANVATVVCPLGPRVRTFVGRRDSWKPAPEGLLPSAFDSSDYLISLFANKTISANQLVALVGAHTTSQQFFVNGRRAGDPQDSTPGVWDTKFYGETTDPKSPRRVFKFQSDINLSKDARTRGAWAAFSGPGGQAPWNGAYAAAYVRMSLLGVYNTNDLTECTKALPLPRPVYHAPDAPALAKFVNGGAPDAATNASNGDIIAS